MTDANHDSGTPELSPALPKQAGPSIDDLYHEWQRLLVAAHGAGDDAADAADKERYRVERQMVVTPSRMLYEVDRKLEIVRHWIIDGTPTERVDLLLLESARIDMAELSAIGDRS